jgi:uncharacterized Zn-finger protein
MPIDTAPCPYCGTLTKVHFPKGNLKGVEKKPRVFLDYNEARTENTCPECGYSFWVYYYTN